jgi:hypothetical protein
MDDGEALLEAWKQTVATQAHLNDITLRIRSAALTIIAAIYAASNFGQSNPWVLAAPLVIWPAFFLMDRYWYYPLFLGAVYHCTALERQAKDLKFLLPGHDGHESGHSILGLTIRITAASGKAMKLHTTQKLFLYYLIVNTALWFLFLLRTELARSLPNTICAAIAINLELLYIYLIFCDPSYLPKEIQGFLCKLKSIKRN